MSTTTLPERLRALRATARPHFQPHESDGTPRPAAFAIVATAERLDDLVEAANLLDGPPVIACPELTAAEVADIAEKLRGGPAMPILPVSVQFNAIVRHRADVAANVEDEDIRAKLIELGWTPPGEAPKLSKSLQAMLDDPDSELVTHGQVREAAQAELATWDQAAPGGPTAYEVAHSICRRLGVAL